MWKLAVPGQVRRYLPLLMMAVGLLLLLYVGAQYAHMFLEQRELASEWEQQQRRTAATPGHDSPVPDDGLTRLSIPKINLNAVIVEGTSHRDLMRGPGHIKDTAEPGATGNAVVTAHRDTFFRHIYELNRGDVVEVQRSGKTFHYEVTGKRVVPPEDVSVIQPSRDNRLTLITCYPTYYIGPAPERLVVFSKLVEQAGPPSIATSQNGAQAAK